MGCCCVCTIGIWRCIDRNPSWPGMRVPAPVSAVPVVIMVAGCTSLWPSRSCHPPNTTLTLTTFDSFLYYFCICYCIYSYVLYFIYSLPYHILFHILHIYTHPIISLSIKIYYKIKYNKNIICLFVYLSII